MMFNSIDTKSFSRFLLHRLKKSHLEKKKVEEELKDLQDSQPSTGKDSSAETRSLKDVGRSVFF